MGYTAKNKASDQLKAKKCNVTRAQQLKKNIETARVKYNMNTPTKKKYIENNKSILPFFTKERHESVHTVQFSLLL